MNDLGKLLTAVSEKLRALARNNAVVARKISVGERHVLPLCEIAVGYGGGSGQGEATEPAVGKGGGGAAAGMAKAAPVAVIIVDGDRVRVESLVQ